MGGLINQMQNRDRWRTLESTVMNLLSFIKGGDFFDPLNGCWAAWICGRIKYSASFLQNLLMNTIISGVVVQYSLSFGYVLSYFGLYRRALNSDCPLLTFPTNSWTDLMLTGNLFTSKSEMLHVYTLSMSQLFWWSLWTSCGWSHTNCRATCSPGSISLFSVSADPWVGASVGSSLRPEVITGVRERIIEYILYLKFLEC